MQRCSTCYTKSIIYFENFTVDGGQVLDLLFPAVAAIVTGLILARIRKNNSRINEAVPFIPMVIGISLWALDSLI